MSLEELKSLTNVVSEKYNQEQVEIYAAQGIALLYFFIER